MVHFARTTVNLSGTSGTFFGARVLPVVMHLHFGSHFRVVSRSHYVSCQKNPSHPILDFELRSTAPGLAAKTMVTAGINTWINFGEPPQLEHSGCHEWGAKGVSENDSDDVSKTDGIRHNIYVAQYLIEPQMAG